MVEKEMRDRCEVALQAGDLRSLVMEMQAEGVSQVAIYDILASFVEALRQEGREADEGLVGDALDYIWGWCSRDRMWFDSGLTSKELKDYRRVKGNQGPPM